MQSTPSSGVHCTMERLIPSLKNCQRFLWIFNQLLNPEFFIRSLLEYWDGHSHSHGLSSSKESSPRPEGWVCRDSCLMTPAQQAVVFRRHDKCWEVLGEDMRWNSIIIMPQYKSIGCLHPEHLIEILVLHLRQDKVWVGKIQWRQWERPKKKSVSKWGTIEETKGSPGGKLRGHSIGDMLTDLTVNREWIFPVSFTARSKVI